MAATNESLGASDGDPDPNILCDLLQNMGKPLMIQEADNQRIEELKARLGIDRKIDVVRAGLALLEQQAERAARMERWKRAVARVAAESRRVNTEFRRHSRLRRS